MIGRLPYEPSLGAVIREVFPSARIAGPGSGLRTRVGWPVVARATSLLELRGGELILAPPSRAERVLAGLHELAIAGVAGVITVVPGESARADEADYPIPVAFTRPDTDFRAAGEEIAGFINLRRRELFQLAQRLHRVLVEPAIAGASLAQLVETAGSLSSGSALIDREGDLVGDSPPAGQQSMLIRLRIALSQAPAGTVHFDEQSTALAETIWTGKERRGIAILHGMEEQRLDDEETILTSLASAAAIALTREPELRFPTPQAIFEATPPSATSLGEDTVWTAIAVIDPVVPGVRLARALTAELNLRSDRFQVGAEVDHVIGFIGDEHVVEWKEVLDGIRSRVGSVETRAGISRRHRGAAGAQVAMEEAMEALRHSREPVARYDDVELRLILGALPRRESFLSWRLGPLLGGDRAAQDLLRTLSVYLETGQNAVAAAARLHVHRNTLSYRLRRIEDLLSVSLSDPETVFTLELALRTLEAGDAIRPPDND